jgi:YidC/Oxa1 family membrane protein insertase
MRTELRFLVAISMMVLVLVGTNILFPPVQPDPLETADSLSVPAGPTAEGAGVDAGAAEPGAGEPAAVTDAAAGAEAGPEGASGASVPAVEGSEGQAAQAELGPAITPEGLIRVQSPLYDFTFSTYGGRLVRADLLSFSSAVEEGPVQLLPPDGLGVLGNRLLIGNDTLDYRGVAFEASHPDGLVVGRDGGPATLTFSYAGSPSLPGLEVAYTFDPETYTVLVEGRLGTTGSSVLFTDVGSGLAFNEARREEEERAMAYVLNHATDGLRTETTRRFEEPRVEPGPLYWVAFKSKFFVVGLLAGSEPDQENARFGGALAIPTGAPFVVDLTVTQPMDPGGRFAYRMHAGPQDYQALSALGRDFQNVNVYGWRFFRPIIRPFTGIITTILVFLHESLNIGYGWVLIIFGVAMRIVLFPLNQKAMRAQLKNMAVQPLLQEAQTKYKDDPERMQKELMKLYKEHGFNPLAGCLPMLLPWPVLIALFFVFQNTVELRGVPFLWIPDLSAADPLYILPVILGASMFLIQWISLRSMETPNPQMKAMMWIMPIFMLFIFANLASGLNLYYATANIATLPQQYWIAGERKRAQAEMKLHKQPTKDSSSKSEDASGAPSGSGSGKGGGKKKGRSGGSGKKS